jgi:hypothetical protein
MEIRRIHEYEKIHIPVACAVHIKFGMPAPFGLLAFIWLTDFRGSKPECGLEPRDKV